jgi:excisionase family DNA binding protein
MAAAAAAGAAVLPPEATSMLTPPFPVTPYDVLTPSQAADYLQVDERTVIEEAESGRLPGQRLGGQWRFLRLAITDWLCPTPPQGEIKSSRDRMLALAGAWRDDPTVDAMMKEIYRKRKAKTVAE